MSIEYTVIKLPSFGKVYSESNQEVSIRSLKGIDEKVLAEATAKNYESVMLRVMENVVKGINPINMTLGDRKYVFTWLAINSYGKDIQVDIECDFCESRVKHTVDLSKFDVIELPKSFIEPFIIEIKGLKIPLRLMRVSDIIQISDLESKGKNSWLARYALTIQNGKSLWENVRMLEDMPVKDIAKIRAFHEQFDHGPDMQISYTCDSCKEEMPVQVSFRIDSIFPFGSELKKYFTDAGRDVSKNAPINL